MESSVPATLAVAATYMAFSIALTTYNAAVLQSAGMPFPLFMTAAQMLFFAVVTNVAALALPRVWPRWHGAEGKQTPRSLALTMAPLGLSKGADIGLSNLSLRFLPVATYTLIKSVAPAFVLMGSLAMRLQRATPALLGAVLLIIMGSALSNASDERVRAHAGGVVALLCAAVAGGLRINLTQVALGKRHSVAPVELLRRVSPYAFGALVGPAVLFEGGRIVAALRAGHVTAAKLGGFTLGGALLAMGLVMAEFLLVKRTSALSLAVINVSKELYVPRSGLSCAWLLLTPPVACGSS